MLCRGLPTQGESVVLGVNGHHIYLAPSTTLTVVADGEPKVFSGFRYVIMVLANRRRAWAPLFATVQKCSRCRGDVMAAAEAK